MGGKITVSLCHIVPGVYTLFLAKHLEVVDRPAIGIDQMQRNFGTFEGICLVGKGSDASWFRDEPFRLVHQLGVWSVTEPAATR